jgi:NAD(P)-dependent dehydrogenase (short-subunit alcohol dehydrogenase family)
MMAPAMGAFDGQVAFVTGASSGIGAALARELARQGADVALMARRTDRLETLARDIRAAGRRALPIACDVTRDGDLEAAAAQARAELGRIDVVVANAGYGVVGPVERLAVDDFRRQFETNVFGVLRTIYATLDDLKKHRGRLTIVGSVNGWVATPGSAPYAMSKFAVRALARALDYELGPAGVSVTHVSPGFVESEIRHVDNQGRWWPEPASSGPPPWLVMPTAVAARQIVRAVARRRREAVITGHGKVAVWIDRHAPWVIAWGLRRVGMRKRSEPGPRPG